MKCIDLSFTLHDIMNPFKVIREKSYIDFGYNNGLRTTGNGAAKIVASRVNPVFYLPVDHTKTIIQLSTESLEVLRRFVFKGEDQRMNLRAWKF